MSEHHQTEGDPAEGAEASEGNNGSGSGSQNGTGTGTARGAGPGGGSEGSGPETPNYPELPDKALTEGIRAGAPTAYPATQELRRRHLPAVLSYARLCGRTHVAGNQLAAQAFALAAQEVFRGIDPPGTWRHHLLMLVQQVAATWAKDGRRVQLDPGFAAWVDEYADTSPHRSGQQRLRLAEHSPMLSGFYRLPAHARGVLWYSVVEGEPDADVAAFTSVAPDSVTELTDKARDALRQVYLRTYAEHSEDRKCEGFRRILEAAARPGDRRHSADLDEHLAECPRCSLALAELTGMADNPRTVLAEGLLGWGGAAYVAAVATRAIPSPESVAAAAVPPASPDRPGTADPQREAGWWPSRGPALIVAAAAGITAVVVAALLAAASGEPDPAAAGAKRPAPPTATPTPVAPDPAPSVSESATGEPSEKPTPSPSRTRTPRPPTRAATPSRTAAPAPAPPTRRPGDGFTQLVNASSGQCLDIADGIMERRTDVITAPCTGARTQFWSLDSQGLLHSYADPDFCLDSRGDTDRGVGIWPCSSADGRNGWNLLFSIDSAGAIRPYIAPQFAATPDAGYPGSRISLQPAQGRADQRWRAGSSPAR